MFRGSRFDFSVAVFIAASLERDARDESENNGDLAFK